MSHPETSPRLSPRSISAALAFLFVLLAASALPAQPPDEGGTAPDMMAGELAEVVDEEAEHEALRELRRTFVTAVNEDRLELLRPHLAEGFTGVMVTDEAVSGFEELEAFWRRIHELMGEGGTYTTEVEADELSRIAGDYAYSRGTTQDLVITGAGKEYRFTSHWTAVTHKEDGSWKLLRVHGSMDPIGNPFVADTVRGAALTAGIGAGLGGLVVGLLLGLVVGKKKRG